MTHFMGRHKDGLEAGALTNGATIEAIAHATDGRQADHMSLLSAVDVDHVHVDPGDQIGIRMYMEMTSFASNRWLLLRRTIA